MITAEQVGERYLAVHHRILRAANDEMNGCGLSMARTKVLRRLREQGPTRQNVLAAEFGLSPHSITNIVDGLERLGLAERQRTPSTSTSASMFLMSRSIVPSGRRRPRTQMGERAAQLVRVVAVATAALERLSEFRRAQPGRQQRRGDRRPRLLQRCQRVVAGQRRLVQMDVRLPRPAPVESRKSDTSTPGFAFVAFVAPRLRR